METSRTRLNPSTYTACRLAPARLKAPRHYNCLNSDFDRTPAVTKLEALAVGTSGKALREMLMLQDLL